MKRKILLQIFLFLSISLLRAQCPSNLTGSHCDHYTYTATAADIICNTNDFRLVFFDDFLGDTLDMSKWEYNPWGGSTLDFGTSKQWFQPENIDVYGGSLHIIADEESAYHWIVNPGELETFEHFDYTGGLIRSRYRFGFGKFEISCKIPHGKGFFPAFWLNWGNETYYDEIDVFEFFGYADSSDLVKNPKLTMFHRDETTISTRECDCRFYDGTNFANAFHKFAVIWDYYKIQWLIDDVVVKEMPQFFYDLDGSFYNCNNLPISSHVEKMAAFPVAPMNIVLNLSVSTGTDAPDSGTPFPGTLEVEYVKFYKKTSCTWNYDLNDYDEIVMYNNYWSNYEEEDYQNILAGNTIALNGDVVMDLVTNPSQQLSTFIASDAITITPTTYINKYSPSLFIIDPDICDSERSLNISGQTLVSQSENNILNYESPENFNNLILVFPNPTKDVVKINLGTESATHIALVDNIGRQLLVHNITGQIMELDVSGFVSGIYYLTIFKGNLMVRNEKIIKI